MKSRLKKIFFPVIHNSNHANVALVFPTTSVVLWYPIRPINRDPIRDRLCSIEVTIVRLQPSSKKKIKGKLGPRPEACCQRSTPVPTLSSSSSSSITTFPHRSPVVQASPATASCYPHTQLHRISRHQQQSVL